MSSTVQSPVEPAGATRRLQASQLQRRQVRECLSCGDTQRKLVFVRDGYHLVRCGHCGLCYISDPPTHEELGRYYSFANNYHSDFASNAAARRQFLERGRRYLAYLAQRQAPGRLLDVGCSAGFFLNVARADGWNVKGLEFSEDSAALGRSLNHLEIHTGELTTTTLPDATFDAVTLWDVIEHLPDPLRAMQQAYRILDSNGVVAISTPNIDGLFPRVSYSVANQINYWTHAEPPAHLTQFSVKTLRALLERAGFRLDAVYTRRIPLSYSFGELHELVRSPKRVVYAAAFAAFALVGPWVGQGDEVVMIARKP